MACFAVIVMCPPERAPPLDMRLRAASATLWPTPHNADSVPRHIIGQLLQGTILEDAAQVDGSAAPKPGLYFYHSFGGFRTLSVIIGSCFTR
jgi:hypothetical protein